MLKARFHIHPGSFLERTDNGYYMLGPNGRIRRAPLNSRATITANTIMPTTIHITIAPGAPIELSRYDHPVENVVCVFFPMSRTDSKLVQK